MRGWPTPIGLAVNSIEQKPFDAEGNLAETGISAAVEAMADQLMQGVRPGA